MSAIHLPNLESARRLSRLAILFILFVCPSGGEAQTIQWQKTIGGSGRDNLSMVQQTSDGGYILGGYSGSGISGDKTEANMSISDYWVVKINSTGTAIEWENTISGSAWDYLYSIQQTSDGGYILGGISYSPISGDKTQGSQGYFDYWIVKLDALGVVSWDKTFGGNSQEVIYSIQQTADGGYILAGGSASNTSGDKTEDNQGNYDCWVLKLDALGVIEWQNTIGGASYDDVNFVQQTADGGYILGGNSDSNISGDKTENSRGGRDYWVVKLDPLGAVTWDKTVGGSGQDILYVCKQTADGGYILGGTSNSNASGDKTENSQGGDDYWVVKLDATGTSISWQNTLGGNNIDHLNSILETAGGGYLVGGYSYSGISGDKTGANQGSDYWVIKLNTSGGIDWQRTIGGDDDENLKSVFQTTDGDYILGGDSGSGISGDKTEGNKGGVDYWVVKLAPPAPVFSGHIRNENNAGIENVTVTITGATNGYTANTLSDAAGYYTFANLPGADTYTVCCEKNTAQLNGVNSTDVYLILAHILQNPLLGSPYKVIGADVTQPDRAVSVADLVVIQNMLLGNISSFPGAPSWRFVAADFVFADPLDPQAPPYVEQCKTVVVSGNTTVVDFVGHKSGDANTDANTH